MHFLPQSYPYNLCSTRLLKALRFPLVALSVSFQTLFHLFGRYRQVRYCREMIRHIATQDRRLRCFGVLHSMPVLGGKSEQNCRVLYQHPSPFFLCWLARISVLVHAVCKPLIHAALLVHSGAALGRHIASGRRVIFWSWLAPT